MPRLGGRAPLGAELEQVARTGRWDRSRYAGRSEARMAVLGAAAARGWQLADVRAAVACGAWKGLAGLYERRSEPGRLERLLPPSGENASARSRGRKTYANGTLATEPHAPLQMTIGLVSGVRTDPPVDDSDLSARPRTRSGSRGGAVALSLSAWCCSRSARRRWSAGRARIEFGTRNLALHSALSHRTVSRVLRMLRMSLTR